MLLLLTKGEIKGVGVGVGVGGGCVCRWGVPHKYDNHCTHQCSKNAKLGKIVKVCTQVADVKKHTSGIL